MGEGDNANCLPFNLEAAEITRKRAGEGGEGKDPLGGNAMWKSCASRVTPFV